MEIETADRYPKRGGGGGGGGGPHHPHPTKICHYWQAGRCNRNPCNFRHSDAPDPSSNPNPKRATHQPPGALVWRNPNAGAPPSKWGGNSRGASGPRKPADGVCKYFLKGSCTFGDKCRYLHTWWVGESFSLLTQLNGHQNVITGIALPAGSNSLYSGSKDETVRVWDCQTGQCTAEANVGGDVGCMLSEGPWVFAGIPNAIKAWNTHLNTEMSLTGPTGQVYAMTVANEMLFAGTSDGQILIWKFSAETNRFEPVVSLSGHTLAVVSLVVGAMRLYSGSMDNTIRVWDLTTLQCLQTLTDHTSVVMSVLCWDQFLISCSLDQTIKIWVSTESGKLEATYTHTEEHGVLALCGMHDDRDKPVLLCSLNDNSIRLYDLPSFSERGKIFAKKEVRVMQSGPGGIFFTGDGTGELKVWRWLTNEKPAT